MCCSSTILCMNSENTSLVTPDNDQDANIKNYISKLGFKWFERIIQFCRAFDLINLIENTIDLNVFNGPIDCVKYLIKFMFYCKLIFLIQKGQY
jgi:hypothetical protein